MNPGSDEAGCRCPVIDNGHGTGYMGDSAKFGWVFNLECPLHGGQRTKALADMGLARVETQR